MIAAALLLVAAPAALEPALTAFARGDYALADSLAVAAAAPPQEGAALYLAGLARFRAGHPAEALNALDRAGRSADAPAPALFLFNRAGCLYELSRFDAAEHDYLAAAALDPALRAIALVNAGFAALDGAATDRARAHADAARALPQGPELVADLDAHLAAAPAVSYREGLAAFDAGRFAEARAKFHRAAELDPEDGRGPLMSGASAFHLGEQGEARRDLQHALDLRLDGASAQAARDYLNALEPRHWQATARLAGGYDSDALQTGLADPTEFPGTASGTAASALATGELAVGWSAPLSNSLTAALDYRFDQLAYLTQAASDRSLQEHGLSISLISTPAEPFQMGASAGGQLAFTGLSGFRGLQASTGLAAWASLDETQRTTTRLDLAFSLKHGFSEFSYLSGQRVEGALLQELRLGAVALEAGLQGRLENIGTLVQLSRFPQETLTPYGHLGETGWLGARAQLGPLQLELSGGSEWREYRDDSYVLRVVRDNGIPNIFDRRRRFDQRLLGSAAAQLPVTRRLSLSLRYDFVRNRSSLTGQGPPGPCGPPGEGDCPPYSQGDLSYDKHVLTLGTAASF